jgi:beta-lactamase regulating signal transducer with metallopeptidase domain
MSECVETLNHWGETFLSFAWPMLWQSSLLIAVVFAFELFFARRIRASVRYALWMVVLVKLILPPALALPTGATWWLWRTHPVVEPPVIQNYTVSYGDTVPDNFVAPAGLVVLPPPKLSGDGWVLLVAVATAAGLLSWLAFRWLRVAQNVRHAATASAELDGIFAEARQLAGLRRRPRLKLIDDAQSPAVYGLLRPVILLPRALAAKLSVRQLRAVLLHEAVHVRRGDVWANCAQTLLQIAYWWHPLLWLANARMRRLREEAVDDAVMLALRDGADAYAPTLLEVAKYAFRRPLASLGLVGILESRSALRQRVERLVDFRPPRRAGITFLSLCGIFAFSAVALPMGQGPGQTIGPRSSGPQPSPSVTTNGSPVKLEMRTFRVGTNVFLANLRQITGAQISSSDGKSISAALTQFFEKAGVDMSSPKTVFFNQRFHGGILFVYATPRDLDIVERIVGVLHDPRGGESRWLKSINDGTASDSAATAGSKERPQPDNPGDDLFDPIGGPKVFAPRDKISHDLGNFGEQVTFPVGSAAFSANVRKETGEMEPIAGFKLLAAKAGVDLSSPPKTVFLSEGMGILFVYALKSDMEPIKRIIADLHCPPTMLHIKARFIEVPQKFFSSGMAGDMFPGLTNGGILPSAEFRLFLHEAKSQKGFEELAEPEATTVSGRQTQMRATVIQPVVTNYIAGPNPANPAGLAISPQTTEVETGPIFDVIPLAFADGYSIGLYATAELRQFFGYASPHGLPTSYATNPAGHMVPLPTSLPALQLCRAQGEKTIHDGQTLVLFPKPVQLLLSDPDKKRQELIIRHIQECEKDDKAEYGNKVLVVLVTATLIDAAGNRFHSEDEMRFAQNAVPPQSP